MTSAAEVAVYIDPPSHHFLGDRLFNVNDAGFFNGDSVHAPYARLRAVLTARGIPVHTADFLPDQPDGRRHIYTSIGMLGNYERLAKRPDVTLSAFFALECPIVDPALYRGLGRAQHVFKRIYSWSDSPSLERFVGGPLRCLPFLWPQAFSDVHEAIWRRTDRKFLVMINGNKRPRVSFQELYTERLRAVEFFGRTGDIDLYGVNWDGPPYRPRLGALPGTVQHAVRALERGWDRVHPDPLLAAARRVYRGKTHAKAETLGQYTFSLCFENMILKGWVTEKIFDCFYAGAIPIYWGAPEIAELIPPACFIDMRQFRGYPELAAFLQSLSSAALQGYRDAARAFLRSEQFRPFATETYVERFVGLVAEDAGLVLTPVEARC